MSPVELARPHIAAAARLLLISHKRPDGDALGSLLGLGHALRESGKTVTVLNVDGCPAALRFLPGSAAIVHKWNSASPPPDLLITLDTSELNRLGPIHATLPRPVDINVDHHVSNTYFGAINIVQPEYASAAELVLELLDAWGLPLSQPTAVCLLTGILTDTLGFRIPNTGAATLQRAMRLMAAGASLPDLLRQSLHVRSFAAARLWGAGLSRLQLDQEIVYTSLRISDKYAIHYEGNDDGDLINLLSTIEQGKIAVIFVELSPALTKVSWRAVPGVDLVPLAQQFGGGGHPAACGAEVAGTLEEVQTKVIAATQSHLARKV